MAGAGAGEVAGVVCGSQGGARWSEDAETVVETAAPAAASIYKAWQRQGCCCCCSLLPIRLWWLWESPGRASRW